MKSILLIMLSVFISQNTLANEGHKFLHKYVKEIDGEYFIAETWCYVMKGHLNYVNDNYICEINQDKYEIIYSELDTSCAKAVTESNISGNLYLDKAKKAFYNCLAQAKEKGNDKAVSALESSMVDCKSIEKSDGDEASHCYAEAAAENSSELSKLKGMLKGLVPNIF